MTTTARCNCPRLAAAAAQRESGYRSGCMPDMRVLVVDDEPLVRRGLISFLNEECDVRVVGEAASGYDAVMQINGEKPDLVFLDVQMPEMNGFDVVASLDAESLPAIV